MINVFQPQLREEELEAVRRVFASNWVGRGKLTDEFEARFAAHLGAARGQVRSVSCCSEALFQAMALLGVGPGDEVLMPSVSFVAAANAVVAAGGRPVFCDVDPRTLNPAAAHVAARLTPRTKALVVLHYGGVPCEVDELRALLDPRGVALVEDSACAVASRYRGRAAGTLGEIGCWSFDAMKILVTGDGGMIWCRDEDRARRAAEALYLGLVTESGFASRAESKWWEFDISGPGRRAIMNDIASAVGLEQLAKLPAFVARRRAVHERYLAELGDLGWLRLPPPLPPHVESSHYFFWVQTAAAARDGLALHLRERGIYTTFRYWPLHRVRFYGAGERLPGADEAADATLCIPLHHSLSDDDVGTVVAAVRAFDPGRAGAGAGG